MTEEMQLRERAESYLKAREARAYYACLNLEYMPWAAQKEERYAVIHEADAMRTAVKVFEKISVSAKARQYAAVYFLAMAQAKLKEARLQTADTGKRMTEEAVILEYIGNTVKGE